MNKKEDRVLIIGAGASGISAAYYLKNKGYKNITVMEKEKRVGGKCYSIKYRGKYYEMGAMMGVPSYKNVIAIMDEMGIKNDGPYLYRDFFNINGKRISQVPADKIYDFKNQFKMLPDAVNEYMSYIKAPTFKNLHPDLCLPFSKWCMKNNVPLAVYAYAAPFTAFGYGYMDDIPAAYVLRFLEYNTLCYFINIIHLTTLSCGMQHLWEKAADTIDDVRLGVTIRNIERKNKIVVQTDSDEEEFDSLIITSPFDESCSFMDVREDEKELFDKIKYNYFNVFAYSYNKLPQVSGYVPQNFTKERLGHLLIWYYRWQDSDINDIVTFYTLSDKNWDNLKCRKILESDFKNMNIHIKHLFMHTRWKYFPHVGCRDMKEGFYDKLEALQGKYGTYYAGEIMNFSNMEKCCEYSKYLIDTYY